MILGHLGPDYISLGGLVNGLPRKTGQPTFIVYCLLNGS